MVNKKAQMELGGPPKQERGDSDFSMRTIHLGHTPESLAQKAKKELIQLILDFQGYILAGDES